MNEMQNKEFDENEGESTENEVEDNLDDSDVQLWVMANCRFN